MITQTEENYLKVVFNLAEQKSKPVSTNAISDAIKTSAASVTDMLKRLSEKKLIQYERYKGVLLTAKGKKLAKNLIRKHRLWEVFLFEKLGFNWDEVHEAAEQLEHIRSKLLTKRLDKFLEYPKFDPHGDPIPDVNGNISYSSEVLLNKLKINEKAVIVGVKDHSNKFLQYLDSVNLVLGSKLKIMEHIEYDNSMLILINNKENLMVSQKVSNNLYVKLDKVKS